MRWVDRDEGLVRSLQDVSHALVFMKKSVFIYLGISSETFPIACCLPCHPCLTL